MATQLIVQKLSWAGVLIESAGQRLVIDGLEGRDGGVQQRIGPNRLPLATFTDRPIDVAVATHLHKDHFDAEALLRGLRKPGGKVVVPANAAEEARATGLDVVGVADRQTIGVGPFKLTAMPAVDGFGAVQVSWVVEVAGRRFFHGGDTLFHGYWWEIAKIAGGIDIAFLPINGARVAIPGLDPSRLPGIMTAEQAAVAARLIQAKLVVPIHYQEFHHPPVYTADLDAEASFLNYAAREKVAAKIFAAGETVFSA